MISTDCYLAVLKKYKESYPNAHFEIITRTAKSPLSPSWDLLERYKTEDMSFSTYKMLLLQEIMNNDVAIRRLKDMCILKKKKDIFVVCYEKDARQCHRSIIKELIDQNNF